MPDELPGHSLSCVGVVQGAPLMLLLETVPQRLPLHAGYAIQANRCGAVLSAADQWGTLNITPARGRFSFQGTLLPAFFTSD